ncbi:MAG: SurA N-terminal domain-containing protein [Pseudomonadota bacterium]
MLQGIRDGARGWLAWVIVIIICVPFAFWGINEYFNSAPKRVIAEVNGVELSEYDFQQQVSQRKRQIYAMFQNQDIDLSFMDKQIREGTLTQMIEEEVLVQSAIEAGMQIGDALLASRIHSIPAFQEDDVFSQQQYEQALRNRGMTAPGFEWRIRRELLTSQISEGVLRSALLTDYDEQQRTRLEKQQRSVSYLIVPASRFNDSVTITDADIETYYKDHAKQYMTPEKVSIEYVELSQEDLVTTQSIDEETLKERYQERKASFTTPGQWKARHILIKVDPNADELDAAEKKAQGLLAKIRAGDSFEELAKQFSDDTGSKEGGGDLGWFGPGMMVKPFEEAVKALKVGEVSELVKSQFGFHIIKLEESKPKVVRPFAKVRTELVQEIQKERADSEFYGQFEEFANLAYEHPDSLEVLTETLNLESKTTELFDSTGGDGILSHRKLIDAAFSDTVLKEGYNSAPIEIGEQHVVVLRVKDHVSAEAKPLAEVKEEIVSAITQEKTREKSKNLGKTLIDQIKENGDPNAPIKEHDLNWSPAQWVERQDTTLGQAAIVSEAFKMGRPAENKALYQGIELGNGDYALVAVLDVKDGEATPETPAENESSDDPRQEAKQQLQQALGQSEFKQLVSGLKAGAEIKDYSGQSSGS